MPGGRISLLRNSVIITLIVFSQFAHAVSWKQWLCRVGLLRQYTTQRPQFETATLAGVTVPIPFGCTQPFLLSLAKLFRTYPSLYGVAIFGSRTHFSHGYLPTAESDLDLAIFHYPELPVTQLTEDLRHCSPLRLHLNFQVHADPAKFFTAAAWQFPRSAAHEAALFRRAEEGSTGYPDYARRVRRRWRHLLAAENPFLPFSQLMGGGDERWDSGTIGPDEFAFNKESIILIRAQPETELVRQTLAEWGFLRVVAIANQFQ